MGLCPPSSPGSPSPRLCGAAPTLLPPQGKGPGHTTHPPSWVGTEALRARAPMTGPVSWEGRTLPTQGRTSQCPLPPQMANYSQGSLSLLSEFLLSLALLYYLSMTCVRRLRHCNLGDQVWPEPSYPRPLCLGLRDSEGGRGCSAHPPFTGLATSYPVSPRPRLQSLKQSRRPLGSPGS